MSRFLLAALYVGGPSAAALAAMYGLRPRFTRRPAGAHAARPGNPRPDTGYDGPLLAEKDEVTP